MDLLVAYDDDPAGLNMAKHLAVNMSQKDKVYKGDAYDLAIISSPTISADWLESQFRYDRYVFLSRHSAESGRLALTCHSTGNFAEARFGGNPREVAIPFSALLKRYMQRLWARRDGLAKFQITLEATHHGPTALSKPCIFVEIGTTPDQWNDYALCGTVASILHEAITEDTTYPAAIGFGGTHYPAAHTNMVINGKYTLGTIIPKHSLEHIDSELLEHVLTRNPDAEAALLDWDGMGAHKRRILDMLENTDLEVVRI